MIFEFSLGNAGVLELTERVFVDDRGVCAVEEARCDPWVQNQPSTEGNTAHLCVCVINLFGHSPEGKAPEDLKRVALTFSFPYGKPGVIGSSA